MKYNIIYITFLNLSVLAETTINSELLIYFLSKIWLQYNKKIAKSNFFQTLDQSIDAEAKTESDWIFL